MLDYLSPVREYLGRVLAQRGPYVPPPVSHEMQRPLRDMPRRHRTARLRVLRARAALERAAIDLVAGIAADADDIALGRVLDEAARMLGGRPAWLASLTLERRHDDLTDHARAAIARMHTGAPRSSDAPAAWP